MRTASPRRPPQTVPKGDGRNPSVPRIKLAPRMTNLRPAMRRAVVRRERPRSRVRPIAA